MPRFFLLSFEWLEAIAAILQAFKENMRAFIENVATFKENVGTFIENVRTFIENVRTFIENVATFKENVKTFIENVVMFKEKRLFFALRLRVAQQIFLSVALTLKGLFLVPDVIKITQQLDWRHRRACQTSHAHLRNLLGMHWSTWYQTNFNPQESTMKLMYRGAMYQSDSTIATAESNFSGKYRGADTTISAPTPAQAYNIVLRYRGQHYIA
jgi:Domain of unknown function (DUF4278)